MALRAGQDRTVVGLVVAEVPVPVLARHEAGHQRVTGLAPVRGRVLAGRGVATADVPALGTPPQVEPPAVLRQALHTPGPRRWPGRVDSLDAHPISLPPGRSSPEPPINARRTSGRGGAPPPRRGQGDAGSLPPRRGWGKEGFSRPGGLR